MSNSGLHCSVLGCTVNTRSRRFLPTGAAWSLRYEALHPAPRDHALRRVWLQRIGLQGDCKRCSSAQVFVCGRHFAPDDYELLHQKTKYAVTVRLKCDAVPTLLLPNEERCCLQRQKLLATIPTNFKMPLSRPRPGDMPANCLASAPLPVRKKLNSDSPNFKTHQCLANSQTLQWKPLSTTVDANSPNSTLPNIAPLIFSTPCDAKAKSSQSDLLSSATNARSRHSSLSSEPAVTFNAPCHTKTDTAHKTKLLCPPSGRRSRDIQLLSAPTAVLTTPVSSKMPQIIHLCSSHDSSKTQKPPSATTVALATSQHAKTRLSQPRLLCSSSNSELPYMPKLSLTNSCQAEELHHDTPESCVTLTTVPGMQAMQCKSNVYQVHTLGSHAKTGHRHVIKVKASTQTDVVTCTTTTQTKTKRLRSRGTNTGPEW